MTGSWASCPSFSQVKALTRYFSEIFICSSSRSARGNLPVTGNAKKCEGDRNQSIQMSNVPVPRIVAGASGTFAAAATGPSLFQGRDSRRRRSRSHEFLSEMLGVRRTTVSFAANTLQNAGVIHYRRGKISIANRKGLQSVSCDCYRTVKQNIAAIIVPEKSASTSSLRRGRVFGRISGRLS